VLQEIDTSKGYVEMTGVDHESSADIAEAVNTKGGRYLEAQIQGSKTEAEEGNLVILAAGDRSLFEDCNSTFQAMGKQSFFLGKFMQTAAPIIKLVPPSYMSILIFYFLL